jgi:hypothetical protein
MQRPGFVPSVEPEEYSMSATAEATSSSPFRVEIAQRQLRELRRRIEATRRPSKELVARALR